MSASDSGSYFFLSHPFLCALRKGARGSKWIKHGITPFYKARPRGTITKKSTKIRIRLRDDGEGAVSLHGMKKTREVCRHDGLIFIIARSGEVFF